MSNDFPVNVFPDVKRNAFTKYTKKNVTEDYIYENLKLKGWKCYKPFVDTGIDIIATKIGSKGQTIYRYIQVKTRELDSRGFYGYTLKPKDFRNDPRHFFLFFCDSVADIILIGMYDYLKLFYDNKEMGITHFANPTFRTNNNKLNSLKFKDGKWTWGYKSHEGRKIIDFSPWVNQAGLTKMINEDIDNNLKKYSEDIAKMKFEMFYTINETKSNLLLFDKDIKEAVLNTINKLKNMEENDYLKNINKLNDYFIHEAPDLYLSHKRYIYDYGNNNEIEESIGDDSSDK